MKKQKKKFHPRWEPNQAHRRMKRDIRPIGHERLMILSKLILILISFFVTSCLSA